VFFSGVLLFTIYPLSTLITPSTSLVNNGLDLGFSILGSNLLGIRSLILVFATILATTLTTTFCSSLLGAIAGNVTLLLAVKADYVGIFLLPIISSCSWGSSSWLNF